MKLEGVIKAHGTYLIRGAKCNPCKNLMIDVDKCDLEWRRRTAGDVDIITGDYKHFSRSGELIEFSQKGGSFFLIYATKNSDNAGNGNNVKSVVYGTPPTDMISDKDNSKGGYVDLVGIGSKTCLYISGFTWILLNKAIKFYMRMVPMDQRSLGAIRNFLMQ